MSIELINGYKVEHDIDSEKARKAVEFYLDFNIMRTDKNGNEKHTIMISTTTSASASSMKG